MENRLHRKQPNLIVAANGLKDIKHQRRKPMSFASNHRVFCVKSSCEMGLMASSFASNHFAVFYDFVFYFA